MQELLGNYGALVIPVAVGLVLLFLVFKVVNAVLRIIVIVIVLGLIGGGASTYARIHDIIQVATDATAASHAAQSPAAATASARVTLNRTAKDVGLNPAYLHVAVLCEGGSPKLHLTYKDGNFLFGILSHQDFVVPAQNVRC